MWRPVTSNVVTPLRCLYKALATKEGETEMNDIETQLTTLMELLKDIPGHKYISPIDNQSLVELVGRTFSIPKEEDV